VQQRLRLVKRIQLAHQLFHVKIRFAIRESWITLLCVQC